MAVVGIEMVRERRWRATVPAVLQYRVMAVVGIEMVRERRWRATVPAVLQYRGNCSQEEGG